MYWSAVAQPFAATTATQSAAAPVMPRGRKACRNTMGIIEANGYYSYAARRTSGSFHDDIARSQKRRAESHRSAAQDHQPVRDVARAAPDRRGRLQDPADGRARHRPRHGLPRADAI